MKKTFTIAAFVVVALLIIGGVYMFTQGGEKKVDTSKAETGDTITYTDNGFSPEILRVSPGATVTVKNDSSGNLKFSSDPHPIHTNNGELNTSEIEPGQTTTFVASKKGTWGYHNHLSSGQKGTIVVE